MRGFAGIVKAASASGAAALLLIGAAAVPAEAAVDCKPCRGGGSITLPLPGGGTVRLVWPSVPAVPVLPTRPPVPVPPSDPVSVPPSPGVSADPGASASTSASPSSGSGSASASVGPTPGLPLSGLPVPVLSPLLPSRQPDSDRPETGSPRASASPSPSASASASVDTRSPRRPTHQDGLIPWGPPAQVPPPLGPRSVATAEPEAAVLDAVRDTGAVQLARRWLPLGIGLALIGAGAALFGWRIRKL